MSKEQSFPPINVGMARDTNPDTFFGTPCSYTFVIQSCSYIIPWSSSHPLRSISANSNFAAAAVQSRRPVRPDKIFAAKKRMQEARKEREKKARCRIDEDAGQSSEYDLSASPDGDEDDTEMEAGDDGDDEMQDPRGPRDRHRKEEEVTINIPRDILSAPAVQEVAGRFLLSSNQVCPTITLKYSKMYVPK